MSKEDVTGIWDRSGFPIIDLHCHIEGSIDPEKSYHILHRVDYPPARDREAFMERVTAFEWFLWRHLSPGSVHDGPGDGDRGRD
jgi:hypothetical protein